MFNLKKSMLVGAALIFQCNISSAQQQNAPIKFQESFNATSRTYFVLPDGVDPESLDILDKLSLRPYTEETIEDLTIDLNGEITKTIILKSSDLYEDWMTVPYKTVIDVNGTSLFKKNGELILKLERNGDLVSIYQEAKAALSTQEVAESPDFTPVPQSLIDQLASSGKDIKRDSFGNLIFKESNVELTINEDLLYENISFLEPTGKVKHKLERQFVKENDKNVLLYKKEVQPFILSNGLCVEKITTINYTNYKTSKAAVNLAPSENDEKFANNIKLFPNPATTNLNVDIPSYSQTGEISAKLQVIDLYNKTWVTDLKTTGSIETIDVSDIPPGIYSLVVQWNNQTKTIHFLKN